DASVARQSGAFRGRDEMVAKPWSSNDKVRGAAVDFKTSANAGSNGTKDENTVAEPKPTKEIAVGVENTAVEPAENTISHQPHANDEPRELVSTDGELWGPGINVPS